MNINLNDLTFGVEIETAYAPTEIRMGGYHRGLDVTEAPSFNGNYWKAESDSSLSGRRPVEFVSPVLKGEDGLRNVIAFIKFLNEKGCKVNPSCGLHIHVGVSSISSDTSMALNTVGKLVEAAKKYENGIYAQSGTARQNGNWCAPLTDEDKARTDRAKKLPQNSSKITALSTVGRYKVINLRNLLSNKNTVEFRAFAGTLNIQKILAHLATVFALTEFAADTAVNGKKIMWKDWHVSGSKSLGYIFKKMAPIFQASEVFRANKSKMRMWAMAMAAKWDQRNGATPEAGAVRAQARVRRQAR